MAGVACPKESPFKYSFMRLTCLGTVFALHKVFPFGDRQILVGDFLVQYYPFLSSLWHKLREGTVSAWSWTAATGHDYVALFAYYMASPLNLLALLVPLSWLRETLTFMLLVKIGFAGLFAAMFLRSTFKQNDFTTVIFSSLYALCAFTIGYYWNIMWFDSFALLPLVMMGLLALMHDGKYVLYICSLAVAVIANFYIGFFICIFVAIGFFCISIIQKLTARECVLKLGKIAACSAIALGMTAVLTIPAWFALQSTYSSGTSFSSELSLSHSFFDTLGNCIAFIPATFSEGLPNLYCGMISILLVGVFMASPKISFREKAVLGGIVVFLLLSCTLNVLDYMIHGFHHTNGLPYRFSFLFSFTLVTMAYRSFLLLKSISRKDLLVMCISAAVFLLAAVFGSQEKSGIIGSVVLCAVYILLFFIFMTARTAKVQMIIRTVLFLVIVTELFMTVWINIDTQEKYSRSKYPDRYEQIQALLQQRRITAQPDSKADCDFYRTEILPLYSRNDSSLYNFHGISFFSSTIEDSVVQFLCGLGLFVGGVKKHSIVYYLASPLANAFLAMRYIITVGGIPPGIDSYWESTSKVGDTLLMENQYYLPLGFMVNEEFAVYAHNTNNTFLSQNDLFRRTTGIDDNLFISISSDNNASAVPFSYEMSFDGMLYAHFIYELGDKINVFLNDSLINQISVYIDTPGNTIVGNFKQGDIISFTTEMGSQISTGYFNAALFEQGYALLADEPYNLTHFSETRVSGTVTALKDGILYTSIPGRNWSVYVNGVKSELLLIDNAMAAVRLSAGTHAVEFRYFNKSFAAGITISLASLAAFALLAVREQRKRRLLVWQ